MSYKSRPIRKCDGLSNVQQKYFSGQPFWIDGIHLENKEAILNFNSQKIRSKTLKTLVDMF